MSQALQYTIFRTRAGWMSAAASELGLVRLTLPHPSAERALQELGELPDRAVRADDCFTDLAVQLQSYFNRGRPSFRQALDLSVATTFQRAIWKAARRIPYGETRSYGELAVEIGRPGAARAVGQAMSRNPVAIIIPCHRVVANSGNLGGFGGGPELKQYLLELEGNTSFNSYSEDGLD